MTVEYFLLFAGVIVLTLFGLTALPSDIRASLSDMFTGLAKIMSTPNEGGSSGGGGCVPNCEAICAGGGWVADTGQACPGGTESRDDGCGEGGVCTCCCTLPGICA